MGVAAKKNAPAGGLYVPDYDVAKLSTGVVHVGFGAFHRAHQAYYIDRYMELTGDTSWGIAAVNLRGEDRAAFARAGTPSYVLKTIAATGQTGHRLMRCHTDFLDWSQDPEPANRLVAQDGVKLVTVTVTESGYYADKDGNLNTEDPVIAAEVQAQKAQTPKDATPKDTTLKDAGPEDAGTPQKSIYAFLRAALGARCRAGSGGANAAPLTVLSCDNLRGNGHLLERNFKAYLTACGDQALLAWVADNVTFPASMVDRITPKIDPALSRTTAARFALEPCATVMAEDFIQWVIEDRFAAERPLLERAGVEFTPEVAAYEDIKIRILNGGHTCLAYLGALRGFHSFDQLMRDGELRAHFNGFETEEVLPALARKKVPLDTKAYLKIIETRFSNRHIADTVERICADGFAKFGIFIRPTLEGVFANGKVPVYGITSIAGWYVFARLVMRGKLDIRYDEPNTDLLAPLLKDGALDAFTGSKQLWGDALLSEPLFGETLKKHINLLEKQWQV